MKPISVRTKCDKTKKLTEITLNGVMLGWSCSSALKQLGIRKTARYIMRLNEVHQYASIRRAGAKRREVKLVIVFQTAYKYSSHCRIAGFNISISDARKIFLGIDASYLLIRLEARDAEERASIPFIARLTRVS